MVGEGDVESHVGGFGGSGHSEVNIEATGAKRLLTLARIVHLIWFCGITCI